MQPESLPSCCIFTSSCASSVACIFGFTFSLAQITATFGISAPNARLSTTAFSVICLFSSASGAILMAASVTMKNLWYVSTEKTAAWLNTLPVLKPISLSRTAFKIIEVSIKPFMTISAFLLLTRDTAFLQASVPSFSSIISMSLMSNCISPHISAIFSLSPTRTGTHIFSFTASFTAFSTSSSCATATAIFLGPSAPARSRAYSIISSNFFTFSPHINMSNFRASRGCMQ